MFPDQSVHQGRHHLQVRQGQVSVGWQLQGPHLGNPPILEEQDPEPQLVGPEEIPAEQSVSEGHHGEQSPDDLGEGEVQARRGPAGSSLEDGEPDNEYGQCWTNLWFV